MRLILFLIFSFLATSGWGQEKYFTVLYDSCETDTTSAFDIIHSVELISFGTETGFTDGEHGKPAWPTIEMRDAFSIDTSYVLASAVLKPDVVERFKRILGVRPVDQSGKQETYCFTPRHAVILRDSNQRIVEIIEICFECETVKLKHGTLDIVVMCSSSLRGLKGLFIEAGLGDE